MLSIVSSAIFSIKPHLTCPVKLVKYVKYLQEMNKNFNPSQTILFNNPEEEAF